ncbi:lytic murein transglycosylase B [Chitiniphilus purpureus]|uniref:Lytic murein transglycosylase B n=1 Tax=Chitiniphilus purpureus TaxID=2981137 RepID=A0ABY6DIV1_9NEIS|nr:lytic murein transglycosylase B [Chitiniphilus sp. CD1]UXY14274.1 lytic murein transglycosylase B [Chitiniphilus sp. CD1]
MPLLRPLLLCLALAATTPARADDALLQREEVGRYLDTVAAEHGFEREALAALFQRVTPQPAILEVFDRPSTSRPWHQFRESFLTSARVVGGARFMRRHAEILQAVQQRYGVPPAIIAAIIGVETQYGRMTGNYRVLDVLTTMAFDYPRRAEFFTQELTQFLLLAREEQSDPLTFMGSYAGAMGWPQFMPSSFRRYAVDWNGDQHRDIWGTPEDVIASVAHYLEQHGWQRHGEQPYQPVNVTPENTLADVLSKPFDLSHSVAELMQRGAVPLHELDASQPAVLFTLETEPGVERHYLGTTNFYVITRYNRSKHYAMAVFELAAAIERAHAEEADLQIPATPPKARARKR